MWAQAFGLVLSPLQQEFGFGNGQTGNISVSFSSGLTAGAFVWGFLVDIIGRDLTLHMINIMLTSNQDESGRSTLQSSSLQCLDYFLVLQTRTPRFSFSQLFAVLDLGVIFQSTQQSV